MKRIFLTFVLLSTVYALFAQQIPRERVVLEMLTATW